MTRQLSVVSCQLSVAAMSLRRQQRTTDHGLRTRSAVTLVELLITMFIITLLAGLVLGVAAVAGETAREAQAKTTIQRLHKLMMEHYDTYKTRRIRVRQSVLDSIADSSLSTADRAKAPATARLYALRELMMLEIPDRWSDVLLARVPNNPMGVADAQFPFYQDMTGAPDQSRGRSGLSSIYLRRYDAIARRNNSITGSRNTRDQILDNQGAECLYMVITYATGDGEARSLFGEHSIGDVDGDGAPEFIDSWDQPIQFLRWAPGFDSQVQLFAYDFVPLPPAAIPPLRNNTAWMSAAAGDHDPFDLYRVDPPSIRLVPLIYCAGRDNEYGIATAENYVDHVGIPRRDLKVRDPDQWKAIFPYRFVPDDAQPSVNIFRGLATDDGASTDNIHSHLLQRR